MAYETPSINYNVIMDLNGRLLVGSGDKLLGFICVRPICQISSTTRDTI